MITAIISVSLGFAAGVLITFLSWVEYDKMKERRHRELICNNRDWCIDCCKHLDYCYGEYKNPDEACDKLVNQYCVNCPIDHAQEIIFKEEHKNG